MSVTCGVNGLPQTAAVVGVMIAEIPASLLLVGNAVQTSMAQAVKAPPSALALSTIVNVQFPVGF